MTNLIPEYSDKTSDDHGHPDQGDEPRVSELLLPRPPVGSPETGIETRSLGILKQRALGNHHLLEALLVTHVLSVHDLDSCMSRSELSEHDDDDDDDVTQLLMMMRIRHQCVLQFSSVFRLSSFACTE
jgi:hypothetical protein